MALGCQQVEGVLYVHKLPVTADGKVSTSATRLAHVECSYHISGGTRGEVNYLEAAPKLPQKLGFDKKSAVANHHKHVGAILASGSSVSARLGTLA